MRVARPDTRHRINSPVCRREIFREEKMDRVQYCFVSSRLDSFIRRTNYCAVRIGGMRHRDFVYCCFYAHNFHINYIGLIFHVNPMQWKQSIVYFSAHGICKSALLPHSLNAIYEKPATSSNCIECSTVYSDCEIGTVGVRTTQT